MYVLLRFYCILTTLIQVDDTEVSIGYVDGSVVVSNAVAMSLHGMAMVYVDETDPATNRAKSEKKLGSVARYVSCTESVGS